MDAQLNGTLGGASGSERNGPQLPHGGGNAKMKIVYTVVERQGKSFWTRVGGGFFNRDGSINVKLDAIPVSGTLQLRDWSPRDAGERHDTDVKPSDFAFGPPATDIPF